MAENSLTNFASVLYSEAEKQKSDVEKQLKDEREKILAEKSAELETKLKREIENCHNGLKHEIGLAISNREAELAKLLRHNRAEAAEKIFDEAAQKLKEFTKTPEYEDYLKRELEGAADEFCEGTTICTARECDAALIKKLCPISNIEINVAADDIIGGFTLRNTQLKIFADCTLKSRLDEQKELFCGTKELVID